MFGTTDDEVENVSKPRYPWWGYIREILKRYPNNLTKNEIDAVEKAIEQTRQRPDSQQRIRLIESVFFKGTHTLAGAAQLIPCDYGTAKRWQQQFIQTVAENFECTGLVNRRENMRQKSQTDVLR